MLNNRFNQSNKHSFAIRKTCVTFVTVFIYFLDLKVRQCLLQKVNSILVRTDNFRYF